MDRPVDTVGPATADPSLPRPLSPQRGEAEPD